MAANASLAPLRAGTLMKRCIQAARFMMAADEVFLSRETRPQCRGRHAAGSANLLDTWQECRVPVWRRRRCAVRLFLHRRRDAGRTRPSRACAPIARPSTPEALPDMDAVWTRQWMQAWGEKAADILRRLRNTKIFNAVSLRRLFDGRAAGRQSIVLHSKPPDRQIDNHSTGDVIAMDLEPLVFATFRQSTGTSNHTPATDQHRASNKSGTPLGG